MLQQFNELRSGMIVFIYSNNRNYNLLPCDEVTRVYYHFKNNYENTLIESIFYELLIRCEILNYAFIGGEGRIQ